MTKTVKSQLFYTVSMMIFITGVSLVLNLVALLPAYSTGKFFTVDDVTGVTLHSKTKPLFLDVKSQKQLLDLLNQCELKKTLNTNELTTQNFVSIDKVVVHCFDHPKIDLVPLGLLGDKMVFHVEGLGEACFILKDHPQELGKLLSNCCDS